MAAKPCSRQHRPMAGPARSPWPCPHDSTVPRRRRGRRARTREPARARCGRAWALAHRASRAGRGRRAVRLWRDSTCGYCPPMAPEGAPGATLAPALPVEHYLARRGPPASAGRYARAVTAARGRSEPEPRKYAARATSGPCPLTSPPRALNRPLDAGPLCCDPLYAKPTLRATYCDPQYVRPLGSPTSGATRGACPSST
jgi:hypothetical protein